MLLAVGYAPISSSASRPFGATKDPILLSEVEHEEKPSGNGDREGGRDVSSPAIRATKTLAYFDDNNVALMSRRLNGQICSHTPSALNAGAKRVAVNRSKFSGRKDRGRSF